MARFCKARGQTGSAGMANLSETAGVKAARPTLNPGTAAPRQARSARTGPAQTGMTTGNWLNLLD
jgi:hypothetical protein